MTDLNQIGPGSAVSVRVVKTPSSEAAAKTIVRILSKDPSIQATNKRYRKLRKIHYRPRMRGGRLYGGRMIKMRAVKPEIGAIGQVVASVDVLRDLKSVSRFVEVAVA